MSYAVDAANNCIAITDPRRKDNPLIYVNQGFQKLTGYSYKESVGRNCRFLQGDDHDQEAVVTLRRAVAAGEDCHVILRNYRKDGSLFYNELYLSAIYDDAGELRYFMGVQSDVSSRVMKERQLQQAVEETVKNATWFTRAILDNLARIREEDTGGANLGELTKREEEVLSHMVRGLTNAEIAEVLGIAENTVRNYVAGIYGKLGVNRRSDAVIWAVRRGLGTSPEPV